MNYIDEIAERVHHEASEGEVDWLDCKHRALYRIYAVLTLAKGELTTLQDVHDAWSAWQSKTFPGHRSLIPFDQLTHSVRELDRPYMEAIHQVARENLRRWYA